MGVTIEENQGQDDNVHRILDSITNEGTHPGLQECNNWEKKEGKISDRKDSFFFVDVSEIEMQNNERVLDILDADDELKVSCDVGYFIDPLIIKTNEFKCFSTTNDNILPFRTQQSHNIQLIKALRSEGKVTRKQSLRRIVTFEEMEHLMIVYGPLKCIRKHKREKERGCKDDSLRRKFHRWFPDFDQRFFLGEDGSFVPIAGHNAEIGYRKKLRIMDQKDVVRKRRNATKQKETKTNDEQK